tara:strand:+ start:895 stop:1125 length:231 start_codon:yes stop_codon:yes gene_type:complete
MIEYLSLTTNPPPLDIEIIVRSSDKTFKTAKIVVFESGYCDDIKCHIEELPKNIDEWAFVNPEDEYEYNKPVKAAM